VEAEVVLHHRPAVDAQHGGVTEAWFDPRRFDDEALDLGAVLARKVDVLHLAELDFGKARVVGVGDAFEPGRALHEDLGREVRFGDHRCDPAVAADVELAHTSLPADDLLERSAVDRNPGEVLLAVVFHRRQHRPAVD